MSLAMTMMELLSFEGLIFVPSKLDTTPRKPLNMDRLRAPEWQAKTLLRDDIARAFADFLTKVLA